MHFSFDLCGAPYEISLSFINFLKDHLEEANALHLWLGMLLREALARVVLLAVLRNLVFQPTILEFMLSKINWKSPLVGALWEIGKPKCLSKVFLSWMLRRQAKLLTVSWEKFIEKMTFDLLILIF